MNLLFLTPQLPYPPRQGTAIRNWGLIHHLAQRRHAITLLTFSAADEPIAEALRAVCQRVITVPTPRRTKLDRVRTLASAAPDLARRLWSPGFAQALEQVLGETAFDGAQLEGLELAPYLRHLRAGPNARLRVIYDAHNVEYRLQQRALETDLGQPARWPAAAYSWLQWPRLRALEAATLRAADGVTCVSAEDAAALRALAPGLTPILVPNGIDVNAYISTVDGAASAEASAEAPTVVFTGKMDYRPNVDAVLWFAEAIWPRIHAAQPRAQFIVVGQQPTLAVRRLNGQAGITVTGAVADARPHIANAQVYVAPLRMGGGTRFKLLEAMALARPIVTTALGAEGFAVRDGRELLLAERPADFAQAVLTVLKDGDRARALGLAGRAFVEARYDWRVIIPAAEAALTAPLTARSA